MDFEIEYVERMHIDRGYISPYFVTDMEKMEASLDNPYILITDKKISAVQDILPILEKIIQQGRREILIIAGEVDGVRLSQQEHNNKRYGYDVLTNQYEDMVESGIIDPAKVTRVAIQHASSVAAMILTTEVLIADVPEKIDPTPLTGQF